MIEIIFQKKQDAWNLYQHLITRLASWQETNSILLYEDRNRVLIPQQYYKDEMLNELKKSFYDFIVKAKRDEWFRSILADSYLFTDVEEQDHIMDIIYSVLEGNRKELAPFMEGVEENSLIECAVNEILNERVSFSFDSFVMFRLKVYVEQLSQWVEIAIDEYKMEQEYQVFIQTLRDFLAGRKPLLTHLYLVIDENMVFYNQHFIEMKRSELFKAIDRKLLVNHPVYVDSGTIAPLLSIAPHTIYLYTDDPQQPLVRTIINIFEERVKISTISALEDEKINFFSKENENIR
ncbi:putative sporulation protein YtxC [Mesobacillus subterraneus]|uniref:putative sporulation protein YtxC n=1 Tax=Mesobacillus subterraneus TaxID=285983 RepID=UPI00203BCBC6|nr:putative sporulation protein YtxC [Mesobacillus subterraneus]MCM3663745.1 putative sporulation protein YtxC [Mesobacillus subterraneus]MCM3683507.1 putative sporulation protein YtxC [Mesobacillus subterraneus]